MGLIRWMMVRLSHSLGVFSDGSVKELSTARYTGWRFLHMKEGGYPNPAGMPIVRPSLNAPPVDMTEAVQLLSFKMNAHNPLFTGDKWRSVHNERIAFTNEDGFDGENPRRDYVNRRDLSAVTDAGTPALPKLKKAIVCGGNFIRGDVVGNTLVCTPGIHGIDANKPLPSVEEILAKHWYFIATTGGPDRIFNFPQGEGMPVRMPYFLREPVAYEMTGEKDGVRFVMFERWDRDTLPDPLVMYRL
jgi:hypothetical protein